MKATSQALLVKGLSYLRSFNFRGRCSWIPPTVVYGLSLIIRRSARCCLRPFLIYLRHYTNHRLEEGMLLIKKLNQFFIFGLLSHQSLNCLIEIFLHRNKNWCDRASCLWHFGNRWGHSLIVMTLKHLWWYIWTGHIIIKWLDFRPGEVLTRRIARDTFIFEETGVLWWVLFSVWQSELRVAAVIHRDWLDLEILDQRGPSGKIPQGILQFFNRTLSGRTYIRVTNIISPLNFHLWLFL